MNMSGSEDNMTWKRFENFGESFSPKISIRATGHIGFSAGAVNKYELKKYEWCELHYDNEKKLVGFKFSNEEHTGITTRLIKRNMDCFIAAKPFLDYFGIDYKPTRSYSGEPDENSNFIIIDLNRPLIIHGRGKKKIPAKKEGDNL